MPHRQKLTAVNHQFHDPVNLERGARGRLHTIAESENVLTEFVMEKCGTDMCGFVLFCSYGFAIIMMCVGIWNIHNCPLHYHIAGYLIFGGLSSIIFVTIRFVWGVKPGTYVGLSWIFCIGLFVVGCLWIYFVPEIRFTKSTDSTNCNPMFIKLAFWIASIELILVAIGICALCITCHIEN